MREPPGDDLDRAMATVNTWDTFDDEPEQLSSPEVLSQFLTWAGAPDLAGRIDTEVLGRFRSVRDELRAGLVAPTPHATVVALNDLLGAWPVTIGLAAHDDGWRPTVAAVAAEDVVATWFAPLVWALSTVVRDGRWDRFGTCDGVPCTCVYLDRTRNRARRYCSDLCNDRVAQAALRRRRAARS